MPDVDDGDDGDVFLRAEVCRELAELADTSRTHAQRISALLTGWNPLTEPPDNAAESLAECATTLGGVADVAARASFVVDPARCRPVALLGELAVICNRLAAELCRMVVQDDDRAAKSAPSRELVEVAALAAGVAAAVAQEAHVAVCQWRSRPAVSARFRRLARVAVTLSARAADRLAGWVAGWSAVTVLSGHDPGPAALWRITGSATAAVMVVTSAWRQLASRFRAGSRRHEVSSRNGRRTPR